MPDLRAHSPSKIAAGFGGTLNLVISAGYIVLVVLLTALPVHLFLGAGQESPQTFIDQCIHFLGSPGGMGCGIALTCSLEWLRPFGLCKLACAFRKLEL